MSAGDGLAVVLVNDSAEPWVTDLTVHRRDVDGRSLADLRRAVRIEPRSTRTFPLPPDLARPADPRRELLVAGTSDGHRTHWFPAEPRDRELPAARLDVRTVPTATGARVEVRAHTLVQDLALLADRVHPGARVDDMLVTLLPGEQVTFEVTAEPGAELSGLADPQVLRCTNQLVTPRARP